MIVVARAERALVAERFREEHRRRETAAAEEEVVGLDALDAVLAYDLDVTRGAVRCGYDPLGASVDDVDVVAGVTRVREVPGVVACLRQHHVGDGGGAVLHALPIGVAGAIAVGERRVGEKERPRLRVVGLEPAGLDPGLREILVVQLDERVVPVARRATEPFGAVDRRVELTGRAVDVVEERTFLPALLDDGHLEVVAQEGAQHRTAESGTDDRDALLHARTSYHFRARRGTPLARQSPWPILSMARPRARS